MFIWGHEIVHLLSPVDVLLGRSAIFDPALFSAVLLGVSWRGGFSSHKVSWCVHNAWYLPIGGIFLFLRVCRPTPLPFGKMSRGTLHYWGFPFDCLCPTFLKEVPKLSENLMSISAQADGFIPSNFLIVLWSCRQVADIIQPLVWRSSCRFLVLWLHVW